MKPDMGIGHIFQINASGGGVPKLAVLEAEVTPEGLSTDRQRETGIHGGPERALCLYPLELIIKLQSEGHSVFPGAMGENLTVSGLDWELVAPGTRLLINDQVEIEITSYTNPCNNLKPYFIDGDYGRVSQTKNPGWSRVYARIIRTGGVRTGDSIAILGAY